MIAVDSSVLIDLIGGDAGAEASEDSLRQALAKGPVVVCDVVVSEVVAGGLKADIFKIPNDTVGLSAQITTDANDKAVTQILRDQ